MALALTCAILGAAGAIPFVLTNSANSLNRATPPSPGRSASSTTSPSSANPTSYSPVGINLPSEYTGNNSFVSSLAFSPSGAALAIAESPGICLWDIATTDCTAGFTSAFSVAFSSDGKTMAAADGISGVIRLWNIVTKKQIGLLTDPDTQGAYSVAFSHDGTTLAAGDKNGHVYLWDVATHGQIAAFPAPGGQGIDSVAFSPDGTTLAAGGVNGSIYVWDVATHGLIANLPEGGSGGINSVAFSHDGTTLAAGGVNGNIYLWNAATHKLTAITLPDHKSVLSVTFSYDGTTLAAGDTDGHIYLWNAATHKLITTLPEPQGKSVYAVAFSPEGKTLATGDSAGEAYLWYPRLRLSAAVITAGVACRWPWCTGRSVAAGVSRSGEERFPDRASGRIDIDRVALAPLHLYCEHSASSPRGGSRIT